MRCNACDHALEEHMRGPQNNTHCPCCQWPEPWEEPVALPVNYATNPFYAEESTDEMPPPAEH